LFVQEACNNYIPIDVNKEYTAVAVCESMGRSTSDALAKVARRATESVNECRPTRLLFAPVQSKAAPSAKKLAPIEIGLDEKGSASILRTKFGCRHDMRGDIGQLLGRPFEDPLIAGGVICTAIVISDNDLRLNADSHGRSGTGRAFMVPVRRTVMPAVN